MNLLQFSTYGTSTWKKSWQVKLKKAYTFCQTGYWLVSTCLAATKTRLFATLSSANQMLANPLEFGRAREV
ncbi:MAG: hypothetical protein OXC57_01600 [Rhodobacteraceae bacterium]|nr:hypothetical protein [Paracoccaceae bacterium]